MTTLCKLQNITPQNECKSLENGSLSAEVNYAIEFKLVLLRFAKKSPTSSLEVDIDVGRPNIDVFNILELQIITQELCDAQNWQTTRWKA